MKVPHIALDANVAFNREHQAGCESYQSRLRNYHDAEQRATPHNFCVGEHEAEQVRIDLFFG